MKVDRREETVGLSLNSKNADFYLRHSSECFYQRQPGTPLQFPPSIKKDYFALTLETFL